MMLNNKHQKILDQWLDDVVHNGQPIETVLNQFPDLADELRPALETAIWMHEKQEAFNPRTGALHSQREVLKKQITNPGRLTFNHFKFQRILLRSVFSLLVVLGVFLLEMASSMLLTRS